MDGGTGFGMSETKAVVPYGIDFRIAKSERFENYMIYHAPANEVVHNFIVFKIGSWDETETVPYFWQEGESCDFPGTSDPAEAKAFVDGSIKWDGCSNWQIGKKDYCVHFCGVQMATSIGRLMERLYEIAAAEMPDKFDRDCAGMPPLLEGAAA
jgi:hypothetical protein